MSEQGESDCEQHKVGLLGVLEILRRMEWKQSELDRRAAAQGQATIGLGIFAIGLGVIGALAVVGKQYHLALAVMAAVLFFLGEVFWFVGAFRLFPKVSSARRKTDLTDGRVVGHGF